MTSSSLALHNAHVTGFTSESAALMIYGGSVTWLLLLVAAEAMAITLDEYDRVPDTLLITSLALNGVIFVAQSIDYVFFHFLFWPITAINWCAQLAALGIASALVAIAIPIGDDDSAFRRAATIGHLVAQALFTASQFSVTLEYIERRLSSLGAKVAVRTSIAHQRQPGPTPSQLASRR